ncbi:MAG: LPS export ABC transporter permease LptF [Cardiobacteriaceae bacterium]|nr:LPS export ABC transporter permease LptF [Cardiobacteriaceae bacterium]
MPILYRYFIRETLVIFLSTNLILLAILLSFRLSSLLAAAAAGNMALSAVWQLVGLQAIRFLVILMPLAFVLAAVMTLGRLYRDQEISAILACGISPRHQTYALLGVAIPISLLLLILSLSILPSVYRGQEGLRQQAQQEAGMILFTPNTFRRLDDGTVVHTGAIHDGELRDFFIARKEKEGHSIILANSGALEGDEQTRHLRLKNGRRLAWNQAHDPTHTTLFSYENADLRLPGANNLPDENSRLRNIATRDLGNSPEHLSEWQNRSNPAIALLIFSLAIPLLARSQPRQGRYQKILPAFVLFALYINLLDLITVPIRKAQIPPLPGCYWLHGSVLILILISWKYQRSAVL